MPSASIWTDEDQAAAEAQGWNILERDDGSFRIEHEFNFPVFLDEVGAEFFIRSRSAVGDPLATKALDLLCAAGRAAYRPRTYRAAPVRTRWRGAG